MKIVSHLLIMLMAYHAHAEKPLYSNKDKEGEHLIKIKNKTKFPILISLSNDSETKLSRMLTLSGNLINNNTIKIFDQDTKDIVIETNRVPESNTLTIMGKYDQAVSKPGYCKIKDFSLNDVHEITFSASKLTGLTCEIKKSRQMTPEERQVKYKKAVAGINPNLLNNTKK